jgi:2-oxoacid:acceptor oxidoreductase gamma subunit (pyruvate/2-ketoisovalerate family)
MVDEIRLHGMGGQGVVAAGELMAMAASFEEKFCRAVPMYGSARRGAPVLAFVQIGEESEATRSMIYHPGYLLVLDPTLPETTSITGGLIRQAVEVRGRRRDRHSREGSGEADPQHDHARGIRKGDGAPEAGVHI